LILEANMNIKITEGQVDLFAMSLFPDLIPKWNQPFNNGAETTLWERVKPVLYSTDPEIHAGDKPKGLPWCLGYSFGRMIVEDYLKNHPMPLSKLLDILAKHIFESSRFHS